MGGFAHVVPFGPAPSEEGEPTMTWTTPQAVDMRYGFEITMYIASR